jgi:hypothetical protein
MHEERKKGRKSDEGRKDVGKGKGKDRKSEKGRKDSEGTKNTQERTQALDVGCGTNRLLRSGGCGVLRN